jgi:hypothetical protein
MNTSKRGFNDTELNAPPVTDELGRLLDERAARARDPKGEKFTLKQIATRHNVTLPER